MTYNIEDVSFISSNGHHANFLYDSLCCVHSLFGFFHSSVSKVLLHMGIDSVFFLIISSYIHVCSFEGYASLRFREAIA